MRAEKLEQSGEREGLAHRHAEYYWHLFEQAEVEWETRPTVGASPTAKTSFPGFTAAAARDRSKYHYRTVGSHLESAVAEPGPFAVGAVLASGPDNEGNGTCGSCAAMRAGHAGTLADATKQERVWPGAHDFAPLYEPGTRCDGHDCETASTGSHPYF